MASSVVAAALQLGAESRQVFGLIQRQGPLTKNELAKLGGFQMSSLNRYLEPLLSEELIVPSGTADSCGGRRPTLYDVHEDRLYVVAVNIATIYVDVMVVDLKTNILSQEHFDLAPDALPGPTLARVKASLDRQVEKLGIDGGKILGIGLASIGPFDRRRGVILAPIVQHLDPRWVGFPIRAELEAVCGLPVVADHGANTSALAEYRFGHGRGMEKLLCVRCGMSIKTSYIVGGAIARTSNNAEDAFGHMSVDIDGLPCVCGNFGCIECYSSIAALLSRFRGELKKGRTSSLDKPLADLHYLDILAAAEAGDPLAVEVVSQGAAVLGSGLANYINLINPDVVTLDGLIIRNSKLYFETAAAVATRKSSFLGGNAPAQFIRNSRFKDPSTLGAAVLAMEALLLRNDGL